MPVLYVVTIPSSPTIFGFYIAVGRQVQALSVPTTFRTGRNNCTSAVKHQTALRTYFVLWVHVAVLVTDVHELVAQFMGNLG